jgi:hypothetical protein
LRKSAALDRVLFSHQHWAFITELDIARGKAVMIREVVRLDVEAAAFKHREKPCRVTDTGDCVRAIAGET